MLWFFAFFFISGFCGLVYEVVWLRLSMASFGVNAPTVSSVLSIFMAGLGIGSLLGGRWAARRTKKAARYFLGLYALCELSIAALSFAVPPLLKLGRTFLETIGGGIAWGSLGYYAAAGGWLAWVLFPCTLLMGATLPFAMAAIRKQFAGRSPTSFSYLYLANLTGAAIGTVISAFVLIELLGFQGTLLFAAALNVLIAAGAYNQSLTRTPDLEEKKESALPAVHGASPLWMLLTTGFIGMAMQVAWIRLFIPYIGSTVYAFAGILAVYLAASAVGTHIYRRWGRTALSGKEWILWMMLAALGLLPLWSAVPGMLQFPVPALGLLLVVLGTAPFCLFLSFITPMLVDRWSGGDPDRAGQAYAVNVLGSIIGPLASGFLFLPSVSARTTIILLTCLPLLFSFTRQPEKKRKIFAVALAVFLLATAVFRGREFKPKGAALLRDYEAVSTATFDDGFAVLKVNGIGMAVHTTVSKYMAHLPLAFLKGNATKSLAIAFGMGTTFRSLDSWGIAVTAVDLVPSVPKLYPRFFQDYARTLPGNRIVIDDGRRFLTRSTEKFDVITVDPPPPIQTAGSSMLYSLEFLELIDKNLADNGILHHWMPIQLYTPTGASIGKAIRASFPYVRAFNAYNGFGTHFLASRTPLPLRTPKELAARLPHAARRDLMEWFEKETAQDAFKLVLDKELDLNRIDTFNAPIMRDDRPFNEYFALRAPGMLLRSGKSKVDSERR